MVLLLHGLGTSSVTWCRNIGPLSKAGFKVIAPDLPGSGESDKPDRLSYDPATAALLLGDFFDALNIDRLSLVGNSAGGLIAGLSGLHYREKVDRLVLVDSGGLGYNLSWFLRIASVPLLGELLYRPNIRNGNGFAARVFHRRPPFLSEVLPEMVRVRSLPGARLATLKSIRSSVNFLGLLKPRYILERLRQLDLPLMVVWGEKDKIIPVSHLKQVRKVLPDCEIRVIPQCGHWPQMERAEEFNRLLAKFLIGPVRVGSRPAHQ